MKNEIYLDTYILQQDMRIRLPKSVLSNLNVKKVSTKFDFYYNSENETIILKPREVMLDENLYWI